MKPKGMLPMLTGGALTLLSLLGGLWVFMTYGILEPMPGWIGPALIVGEVGGLGLLIFGVWRLVRSTLAEETRGRTGK